MEARKERDLKTEFERLGVVMCEPVGFTTKKDVFSALDAMEANMKKHPDDELKAHIQQLVSGKDKKRSRKAEAR